MTRSGSVLWLPVLLTLVILQSTLFSYVGVLGVTVQTVVVMTLAWTLWHGTAEGLIWAFGGGLLLDLMSTSPVGISSLALMAGVLVMAPLMSNLNSGQVLLPLLIGALGTLIFQLVTILFLNVAGYAIPADALIDLPQMVLVHTLLIVPLYWIVRALERTLTRGRRVEL